MRFDANFITYALEGVSILYGTLDEDATFVVDSRLIDNNAIFIALPGKKVNGHDFVVDALKCGAAGVIIQEGQEHTLASFDRVFLKTRFIMTVKDTLQALFNLAYAWRSFFSIPIIGITGSVGKTSTKELIARILARQQRSYMASEGNQNTQIGVALNILRLRSYHEVGIFEVGIGSRGEMKHIAHLLRPTIGVITCIGHSHMEGLGSLTDIAIEKRDLFSVFRESDIGIINGDQPILSTVSYPHPVIKFGLKMSNQIQARKIRVAGSYLHFVLKIYNEKYSISVQKVHAGFVFHALAATAVAYLCGVPNDTIVSVLQSPMIVPSRFQEKRLKGGKGVLIDDCYNANPESMKAALLAFQHVEPHIPKVAVLGDMLELGVSSPFWHRQLGRFLKKVPSLRAVILVGSMVEWTKKTLPIDIEYHHVQDWSGAVECLDRYLQQESRAVVLVKGSRGIGLDNVVNHSTEME